MTVSAQVPQAGASTAPGLPTGAVRMSRTYYDQAGVLRTAADPVPVDGSGSLTGQRYRCRQHGAAPGWVSLNVKTPPACEAVNCGKRMVPVEIKRPPLLPWRALWDAVEMPLRPVWFLAGAAGAGVLVEAGDVPALALLAAAPVAGEVSRRWARRRETAKAVRWGRLERNDPDGDRRLRDAIDRQSRMVGYTVAAGGGWLALAAAAGVDPTTPAGWLASAVLLAVWGVPAFTWWRKQRIERNRPRTVLPDVVVDDDEPVDAGDALEMEIRRIWDEVLAVRAGQLLGRGPDGVPVKAATNGKLAGTRLDDWHRVTGGWGATIVGPIGAYESEAFAAAVGKIASAYSMKKSMITVLPDPDDENQATLLAQRNPPIKDAIRWSGPASINAVKGVAPVAMYADGADVLYELYRPGWGVPHVAAFGTTGSGKSEFLNQLFTIDRWAHHVDEHGVAHGIVANFLIDPQQGQSFAPFLDDLAAPVATSLDEAILLVEALTEEMLRRNRYLARVEYRDDRGRKRRGRKWWNPIIDGPILSLTIDEAHDYLSVKKFAEPVTKAGRMWRKCGGQLRVATHTPLLSDLGGSMALRDMLTGGFVWVGRTANSLSGPTAFNGRLPADPRSIPQVPGLAYILTGLQPKAMLARTMWEPDYYDWVRDDQDQPIGHPAVLPQVTLDTFGKGYAQWVEQTGCGELWTPAPVKPAPARPAQADVDAVMLVLALAQSEGRRTLSMDDLDGALQRAGTPLSTLKVRKALAVLREQGLVVSTSGQHGLSDAGMERALEVTEALNG